MPYILCPLSPFSQEFSCAAENEAAAFTDSLSIPQKSDEAFGAVAQTVGIAQSGRDLTFQSGSMKAVYTLDGNTTVTPSGDVSGLKTRAHWEGAKLHLHYKRGENWCRDVLSVNGNTLTILRDLESGGGSTTRTITDTKKTQTIHLLL